jgi:hypothetical protein
MPGHTEKQILGVFPDEAGVMSALKALGPLPWKLDQVHAPFPSHSILEILKLKKSRVGYFTLTGGILGFLSGLGLAIFTAMRWGLIISGKPVVALIPFFIVGFEFTILFSVLGNLIGFLILNRLPEYQSLKKYDPKFSSDHFGLSISCKEEEQEDVKTFLRKLGGDIKSFD